METFVLDKYSIFKNMIGSGTFSSVYKGFDSEKNMYVAVKKINRRGIEKMRNYIDKEIEIMRKLDHLNIIKLYDVIYDIEDSQENIYLILEYCPHGDLSNFLNENIKISENECRKYLKQLSEGLKYLTDNKIFHRDLKPQNILVGEGNILKITDFGFAKTINSSDISETFCGSPLYMAPEILTYQKYSYNADLWSVGVILYELLTGETPYTGNNLYNLVSNIKNNELIIPNYKNLSYECKHLLFSLLQKDPEKRISWEKFYSHPWFSEYSNINNLYDKIFEEVNNESLTSSEIIEKDNSLEEELMFEFEEDLQNMNNTQIIKKDVIDEFYLNDFVVISNSLPIEASNKNFSNRNNKKSILNNIFDSIGNISSSLYSYAKSV